MENSGIRQAQDFAENPDWLFQGIHGETMQYLFARIGKATYRDSSFLDHRMDPVPGTVKGAPMHLVNRVLNQDGRPANYIFHSAFCCSTLFSNCLQAVSNSLVLKEPQALGRLADALSSSQKSKGFNRQRWQDILTPCLNLLEKTYPGQQGVIIKPANPANNLIRDILSLRPSKTLFMYGSLSDFLLSNLKGLEESRQMVPPYLERLHPLTDYVDSLPMTTVRRLGHLQQCALLWHTQLYHFSMLAAENDSVCCLAASDFLLEPESVVSRALAYFELPCDDALLDQLVQSGPLSRHSKSGGQYDAGTRAEENAALRKQHDGVLNETLKWMDGLMSDAPIGLPLQPEL